MTVLTVTMVITLALLLGAAYAMPSLVRPTLPFGVRVPDARAGEPVIAEQRRRYRRELVLLGVPLVLVAVVVLALTRLPALLVVAVFVVLLAEWLVYYRAHVAIAAVKRDEHWYDGLRQGVVADTSLRTDPPRFPWPWAVPGLAVLVVTVVAGILRYPSLPDTLVLHYGLDGRPDHQVATSVGVAFLPVFVQLGVTALFVLIARLSFRARAGLDAAHPSASARQHRDYLVGMAKGLMVLLAGVNVSAFVMALGVWNGFGRTGWVLVGTLLPVALGVAGLAVLIYRAGQEGHRSPAAGADEETGTVQRDDDRFWRGGLVYVNRDDPAIVVPKRFGVGWTVNFGNRWGWVVVVLIVVAIALPATFANMGRP